MTIDGVFYKTNIKAVLNQGAMNVAQIKAMLKANNIKLDETQILEALDSLIKNKMVVRSDGKFALSK